MSKTEKQIRGFAAITLICVWLFPGQARTQDGNTSPETAPDVVHITVQMELSDASWVTWKGVVAVARQSAQRARGLMFRKDLRQGEGMLFTYDRPEPLAFWMKNTPTALSALAFDRHCRVLSHTKLQPHDEQARDLGTGTMVLEILQQTWPEFGPEFPDSPVATGVLQIAGWPDGQCNDPLADR